MIAQYCNREQLQDTGQKQIVVCMQAARMALRGQACHACAKQDARSKMKSLIARRTILQQTLFALALEEKCFPMAHQVQQARTPVAKSLRFMPA